MKTIAKGDLPPFERINPGGSFPLLLVCDHASYAVPPLLKRLGLPEANLRRHIGWDIGARDVTEGLARLLDAPAVVACHSRLLIDPNRAPEQEDSITAKSDGILIPANEGLDEAERTRRVNTYFRPYHEAIEETIDSFPGGFRALLSIHTFTPALQGEKLRPWEISILWKGASENFARKTLEVLHREEGLIVGENVPYAPEAGVGYTTEEHGDRRGLPNLMIEIRQDLADNTAAAYVWSKRLELVFREVTARLG